MQKIVIHYAEIALKKGNFKYFENKLIQNIKKKFEKNKLNMTKILGRDKRLIISSSSKKEKLKTALQEVFGIKHFSFVDEINRNLNDMKKYVQQYFKETTLKRISFETKRSDKTFQSSSIEINKEYGEIARLMGIKVDYKNADEKIYTEITTKSVFMYSEKINGLGGLPVGTSGKVLCLLSGGIDSVVAAWLMMKRGCGVDFVHFHALKDNKEVKNSKIAGMARSLNRFQFKSKLYIIPYSVYALESDFYKKYDLVAFKHYILKTANRIGNEKKYFGIVTGDNLSQVASQTIENIKATSMDISLPIFRPLLTYDKQEIINLSKKIGTFDLSIEKYKDCCSIVSKNPSTKTNFGKFKRIIEESNMNDLIDNSLKEMEEIEIN